MIICDKCHTPNDDAASSCKACGAALAGQQLAAALEAASQPDAEAPAVPPAAPAASDDLAPLPPSGPPADPAAFVPLDPSPLADGALTAGDPTAAQSQINEFMAEQKARKRNKRLVYLMVFILLGAVGVFLVIRSQAKKAKRKKVAKYVLAFRAVDDKTVDQFWSCTVGAKHTPIRLAKDGNVLTSGLSKAFEVDPGGQPEKVRTKCLPLLAQAAKEFREIKNLPDGFAGPTEDMARVMATVEGVFKTYLSKLEERQGQAKNEKKVLEAAMAFHTRDPNKLDLAVGYAKLMKCAIPDYLKLAKKVKKPPETYDLAMKIFNLCKADSKFADKFRLDCFGEIGSVAKDPKKPSYWRQVNRAFASVDTDKKAIARCFKRANRGFGFKELKAVGEVWVKYHKVRNTVMNEIRKYKAEE